LEKQGINPKKEKMPQENEKNQLQGKEKARKTGAHTKLVREPR